jgi:hypothetical protein
MRNVTRQIRAYEGEAVEILWIARDGRTVAQSLTMPADATGTRSGRKLVMRLPQFDDRATPSTRRQPR